MIESIKKQGEGWLVNGNKSVPNDGRNTDCQEVLLWLEGITEEYVEALELHQIDPDSNPMPELIPNTPIDEFTPEELEAQAAAQRLAELQATDADMARIVEDLYALVVEGTPIPQAAHDKITNRKNLRSKL